MDDLIQFDSPSISLPSTSKVRPSIDVPRENQLTVSDYFERESLGVLPDNFFANKSFLNTSDIGRESLGILNISNHNGNFLDRLSLSALNDSLLMGRESLGILNLQALMQTNNRKNVPDLILTLDTESCETGNVFTAKPNTLASASSFRTSSLEGPSKIYSVSSKSDQSDDIFNNAIFNSHDFVAKLIDNERSELNKAKIFDSNEQKSSSTDDREDQAFFDSIHLEANHVVSRIADYSMMDDDSVFLDSTAPPEELLEISNGQVEEEQPKVDTETVFKTVDKLLVPVPTNNFDIKAKQRTKSAPAPTIPTVDNISAISQLSNHSNDSKKSQNLSILHDSRKSNTSVNNRSKDTKEIIHNLSEILNNSRRSDVQKSEGYQMLENLANLLCDSSIQSLEDSGHSSVNIDEAVAEDVLDLRANSNSIENFACNKSETSPQPLNLSLKGEIKEERRLSQSFSAPSTSKLVPKCTVNATVCNDKTSAQKSLSNIRSTKSFNHNSLGTSSIAGKLRTNKTDVKRGPMKAVLPINVTRIEVDRTPKKSTLRPPSIPVHYKRTSTPIHDPKMRPMAASTPTAPTENTSKEIATSPLARPRSSSISEKKRHTLHNTPVRRNSITEPKGTPTLKRSFSSGSSGINSVLSQVRHNISLNLKEAANKNVNKTPLSKLSKLGMGFKSRFGKENAM